jgi:pimeloyl-ACP methyl ester carboxylesterase
MKLRPVHFALPMAALWALALSCARLDAARTRTMAESDLFEPQRARVRPEMPNRRNVEVRLPDGNVLRGIATARPEPLANIIYFGGGSEFAQAGTLRIAEWADRYNVNVAFIDYRGYGASSGAPSIRHMTGDAISVFDRAPWMRGDAPTIAMGFAIGSIPATYLAAHRPVAGLVLLAPISSLDDEDMYRRRPTGLSWRQAPFAPLVRTKPGFDVPDESKPVRQIGRVSAPLLLIHGKADGTVPPRCGMKVYESAPGDKALLVVPGAGHDPSSLLDGGGAEALALFLLEHLGIDIGADENVIIETIHGSE